MAEARVEVVVRVEEDGVVQEEDGVCVGEAVGGVQCLQLRRSCNTYQMKQCQ